MKKFLSLVGVVLKQQYRVKPSSTDKPKKGGAVALIVLVALCFCPILGGVAFLCYALGQLAPLDAGVITLLLLANSGITLLFGLPSVISQVYNGKGNDKLLPLPINSQQLFFAKLFAVYVNEATTSSLLVLVTLLPFGIGSCASWQFYAMLLPIMLLVPLLPLLLSALLAMPIAILTARLGKNGVAKNIISLVAFIAVMLVYMLLMQSIGVDGEGDELAMTDIAVIISAWLANIQDVMAWLHPLYTLSLALGANDFIGWLWSFALTLAEFAVIFAILYAVVKPFFGRVMSLSLEGGSGNVHTTAHQTERLNGSGGVVRQLVVTDFKRTIRDPQMGFQVLTSFVVCPLVVILLSVAFNNDSVAGESGLGVLAQIPSLNSLVLLVYLLLITAGTNTLALFPVSRENRAFYLIKTLPVPFEKYLHAKVVLAVGMQLAAVLLTAIAAAVFWSIGFVEVLLMVVVLTLIGYGATCITTLVDLKSPKLDWTNFQQSLKNSKNAFVGMGIGFVAMLVIGAIGVACCVWYYYYQNIAAIIVMWAALIAVSAVFAYVANKIMVSNGARYFDKIEP